jgi:hypothetical protein
VAAYSEGVRAFVRLSKPLVCAHCDAVIGTAAYRPLVSWRLDITSPEGDRLTPVAAPLLLRIAEQQLANAAPEERDEAQWRVRFIARQLLEVIYDLPCRQGHRTLMTSPQVARALRQAKGNWVYLKEAAH